MCKFHFQQTYEAKLLQNQQEPNKQHTLLNQGQHETVLNWAKDKKPTTTLNCELQTP